VTFNLNIPLADAIDDLPVKNRSEWMNKVLPDILAEDEDRRNLSAGGERALESISNELLFETALSEGIMDTFSESQLIAVLLARNGQPLNNTNIALTKRFLSGNRPRAPFTE
jgi:hypothetical protein